MDKRTVICTLALLLQFSSLANTANPLLSYNQVYGWKQLDYKFPSDQIRTRYLSNGEFIPQNNVITGVKVKDNRLYLTIPRWRPGVPSSLAYVDFDPSTILGAVGEIRGLFVGCNIYL